MSYLETPVDLIYKQRKSLRDFGVKTPGTLNKELFSVLRDLFATVVDAEKIILTCFNNAYYVSTILHLEEFPELRIADCEKKLLESELPLSKDVCAASMGMVSVLLSEDSSGDKKQKEIIKTTIRERFSYYQLKDFKASFSFHKVADCSIPNGCFITPGEFAPRNIIEAIEHVDEQDLVYGSDYVCERLGKLDNYDQQVYGKEMALQRLRNFYKEYHELEIQDRPIFSDMNSYTINAAIRRFEDYSPQSEKSEPAMKADSQGDADPLKSLKLENEQLKSQLKDCCDSNSELRQENEKLKADLKELREPIEELIVHDKVRMELALILFSKVGLTEKTLNIWGNKQIAAKLMTTLLGIKCENKRGNPAQSCATYISDEDKSLPNRYKPEIEKINSLLEILGIKGRLSLDKYLKEEESEESK